MNRVMVKIAVVAFALSAATLSAQRVGGELTNGPSDSIKGSVLIYPAVEVKWGGLNRLKQDTLITLTNDTAEPVNVRLIYVNGDPPQRTGERTIDGWNTRSTTITLTVDQPLYFSADSGDPIDILPFKRLALLGRPDPEGEVNTRVVRGFIVAIAVDEEGEEIVWNQLGGSATTINYDEGSSWEYGAVAFQALSGSQGSAPDEIPGRLMLNGKEYQAPYEKLCMNFFTWGACAPTTNLVTLHHDTDLTLLPLDMDFRLLSFPPTTTIASFVIHNQNEVRFAGTEYQFTCWDQRLLSRADEVQHQFSREVLQTDFAKAAIDALPDIENCAESERLVLPTAMVGVSRRDTRFSTGDDHRDSSGRVLAGEGCEEAAILFNPMPPGEEDEEDEGDTTIDDESALDLGKGSEESTAPVDTGSGRTRQADRPGRGDSSSEGDTEPLDESGIDLGS